VAVDPLYVVLSRARITNADEVVRALDRSEDEVPVDLSLAPGAAVLGRRTPFPGPEGYAEPTRPVRTPTAADKRSALVSGVVVVRAKLMNEGKSLHSPTA
jgi:hypothetical protein